jgi:histone H2B
MGKKPTETKATRPTADRKARRRRV